MKKTKFDFYKFCKHLYSVFPFKKQLCFLIKYSRISNDSFYKRLKFKGQFNVVLNDYQSFKLFHFGGDIENETFWKGLFVSWENETGWIWNQLCRTSNIIFDIGANSGIYGVVAKSINPEASVYAFEPSKATFKRLLKNNSINNYNIICEQIAVSNIDGFSTFYDVPNENQTSASLSSKMLKDAEYYDGEIVEYEVQTSTLAKYVNIHKLNTIDLIKIDVEMHEAEVIEGLGQYLYDFKPVIIIEVLTEEVARALNSLIGNDFIIYHLKGLNNAIRIDRFIVDKSSWNFLFYHKDLEDSIKKRTTLSQ